MMMDGAILLQLLNVALTGGVLVYAVRVEHRFTALEVQMKVVLHRLRLADE